MRGKVGMVDDATWAGRITPAYAGKSIEKRAKDGKL